MGKRLRRVINYILITIIFTGAVCVPVKEIYATEKPLKTVSVAYYYDDSLFDGKYDVENKSGIGYEYLQAIANFAGWKYKYVYGDYNYLMEQFMLGKIDLMPMVPVDFDTETYYENLLASAKNEESRRTMESSEVQIIYPNQAMNSVDYYLCIPAADGEDTIEAGSLYWAKIGVPATVKDEAEGWLQAVGLTCQVVVYDNVATCINELNKGKVHAIIGDGSLTEEGFNLYKKLGSIEYFLVGSTNNREVVKELNESLDRINSSSYGLSSRLQGTLDSSVASNKLSTEEKEWLIYHKSLNVGTLKDDLPYSYYDEQTGEKRGFVLDAVDLILGNVDADVELNYSFYNTYEEMLEALNSGEIDIAFPMPDYLYQSEVNNYMCTESIAKSNMVLVFKNDYSEGVYANIAYSSSEISYHYDEVNYPQSNYVEYISVEDCIKAVNNGEVLSTVLDEVSADKYVRNVNKYKELKCVILPNALNMSLGVKRGNVQLFTMLNRGVSFASENEFNDVLTSVLADEEQRIDRGFSRYFSVELLVIVIVFVVLIAIIIFLMSLIRRSQKTSKQLKKANKEIKGIAEHQQQNFDVIGILARDYSSVYKVDVDTEEIQIYRVEETVDNKYGDLLRLGAKYTEVFNQYVRETVYEDDKQKMYDEIGLNVIKRKLKQRNSYAIRYRKIVPGQAEPRYFEFRVTAAEADINGRILNIVIAFIDCNDEIVHELQYMKSLEKALKSDAVITGLTGDFDWVSYIANTENVNSAVVTNYRIGDLFTTKFENWDQETNFGRMLENLANNLVIKEDKKRFVQETKFSTIIKHLNKDIAYYVNFRTDAHGFVEYYQLKFVADIVDGKLFGFICGFHSVDDELKKEKAQQEKLESMVQERTIQLEEKNASLNRMNNDIIELMGNVVEGRDSESGQHVKRVKDFTNILAIQVMNDFPEFGLTPESVEIMTSASALHDVGKITIPDSILLKPGRLTAEEFEIMKSHTVNGCAILDKMPADWDKSYMQMSMDICRYHHEKYDGRGYPDGLRGDNIPISAQIVAVADCYDALVSKRVYKDAFTCEKAFEMIYNGECGVFSPRLMDSFKACKDSFANQVKVTNNE